MNKLRTLNVFFSWSALKGTVEDPRCKVSMTLDQLYCMNGPHTTQPTPTVNNNSRENPVGLDVLNIMQEFKLANS